MDTNVFKRFGKQHGRNMKATRTKTRENTRLLKRFGKQHGHYMKATCTKTWENTRFLKRCGKQHGHNMKATCRKTWENTRFLKRFGKQHGRNMKATCLPPRIFIGVLSLEKTRNNKRTSCLWSCLPQTAKPRPPFAADPRPQLKHSKKPNQYGAFFLQNWKPAFLLPSKCPHL